MGVGSMGWEAGLGYPARLEVDWGGRGGAAASLQLFGSVDGLPSAPILFM